MANGGPLFLAEKELKVFCENWKGSVLWWVFPLFIVSRQGKLKQVKVVSLAGISKARLHVLISRKQVCN